MRVYAADLDALLHDIRHLREERSSLYATDSYDASRALVIELRSRGSDGMAYESVRRADGECTAIFRPRLLTNYRQERHLCYVGDGQSQFTRRGHFADRLSLSTTPDSRSQDIDTAILNAAGRTRYPPRRGRPVKFRPDLVTWIG
ncbi:RES family NAD+ phosphorylase [Sphingobium sp. ZW T5_29]|uniref:RES family NAD+ phosphorylase n=1 Tax=Sphingobium sp. ZW T5_29 TaxID=3378077 RepID=UPI003854847A